MLHPIGSHAPRVYWRRRFVLSAALLALIVLTAWVLRPGGDKDTAAAHNTSPASSPATPAPRSGPSTASASKKPKSSAPKSSKPAGPAACARAKLKVAAVAGKSSYAVGDKPNVMLQVTNTGSAPCVQDLSDSQVELRVYNGESRVWGSHDCTIQPGASPHTLAPSQPVRVSVVWSGLSSQPKCAGTRQRVGAGTYTLYALLAEHEGTAAQFSIR
jgi:hypothetical protein